MSTDQGNTWIAKNNGILSGLNVYSMVKNDSLIFAGTSAGVFRSPDNGEHWFQVNSGLASLSIKVLTNAADGILAGTSNGLYFTSDNGYQWVNVSDGLPDMDIKSVEVSGDIVFVGSGDRGVWRNSLWVVTGIIDAKKPDNVSIYPVPVRKTLTIRSKTPGISQPNIVIYNMMGECIRNTFFNYTDDPMTMDVSSLSPGQYLLVLREAGVIEVQQFIVKK